MKTSFLNLIHRAWAASLVSGSSTSASVFYLGFGAVLLTFLITILTEWFRGGKSATAFYASWKQWPTYVIPASALAILWLGLLSKSIVVIVYFDHAQLRQQNSELTSRNTQLTAAKRKSSPEDLQAEYVELSTKYEDTFGPPKGPIEMGLKAKWINDQARRLGYSLIVRELKETRPPVLQGFVFDHSQISPGGVVNPSVSINYGPKPAQPTPQ